MNPNEVKMCESIDDYANIWSESLFPDHFIYWKFLGNFIYNLPLEVNFVDQMLVVMDHINHPDHFLLDFVLELNCMSSGETRGEPATPTPSHAHLGDGWLGSNIIIALGSPLMIY